MVLAGQGGVDSAESRSTGSPGSELWVSDNGATNHVASDPSNVYDWVKIPPGREKVLIGSRKKMRVRGVGCLNLKRQAATDFNLELTSVYATEGTGFNLFSLHDAQSRQTITLGKEGVHLLSKQLTFPRSEPGSYLYATRVAPTPTPKTAFTSVPVISGSELPPPPPVTVSVSPPSCRRGSTFECQVPARCLG